MANIPNLSGADKFLSKVEEIESLIKDLASSDTSTYEEAKQKTDEYLSKLASDGCKVAKSNKNVINTRPSAASDNNGPDTDKEGFMLMMEKDAEERYERRKRDEKFAMEKKELGNDEFKRGNYEKAVEYYSEGLQIFKDTTVLWTNRAQAYIKLGEYEKALTDCDWATRVFENCLKAYIHMGKAHLGLKQFDQAVESYDRAMKIEPKKRAVIENYIKEVESARITEAQERTAREKQSFGDVEAKGLAGVLENINREGQLTMYYSGGLRILAEDMKKKEDSRTLFRLHGGIELLDKHFLISKCFSASPRSLSRDEIDLCEAAIDAVTAACTSNEENQSQFLELPQIIHKLSRFLETKSKTAKVLKLHITRLLLLITGNELQRQKLVKSADISTLISALFGQVVVGGVGNSAMSVINNLALTVKFKQMMREKFDEMIKLFEQLIENEDTPTNVLPQCLNTVANLCADKGLQLKCMKRNALWEACHTVIKRHAHKCHAYEEHKCITHALLGLLISLTTAASEPLDTHALEFMKQCIELIKTVREPEVLIRTLTLTSAILQHSSAAREKFADEKVLINHCVDTLSGGCEIRKKICVKCLALCTQNSDSARDLLIHHPQGLKLLLSQLKHNDESTVGNAALCLGHLASFSAAFCRKLATTNIIMDLLVLARDAHKPGAAHNGAILIAKLCQADNRHLEKLRALHGLEILHDVLKNVKE